MLNLELPWVNVKGRQSGEEEVGIRQTQPYFTLRGNTLFRD